MELVDRVICCRLTIPGIRVPVGNTKQNPVNSSKVYSSLSQLRKSDCKQALSVTITDSNIEVNGKEQKDFTSHQNVQSYQDYVSMATL